MKGLFLKTGFLCVVDGGKQHKCTNKDSTNKESGIRNRIFYHRGHGEARGRSKIKRLIHEGAAGPWHEGTPRKTTSYFLCHRERRELKERFREIRLILCNSWICSFFVIHNILSCKKIEDICKMCRPDPYVFRSWEDEQSTGKEQVSIESNLMRTILLDHPLQIACSVRKYAADMSPSSQKGDILTHSNLRVPSKNTQFDKTISFVIYIPSMLKFPRRFLSKKVTH